MNRRFFMKALAASLSVFGLGKLVQAEEPKFRYSKFFRRCDEATMDEFRNTVVIDEQGKAHTVPLIWATDDRAASYATEANADQIKLPLMNLYRGDMFFAEDKIYCYYHLTLHGLYQDNMDQMSEQAILKFTPKMTNKVGEYTLCSLINNYYPGGSIMSVQTRGDKNSPAMRGDLCSSVNWGKQGEWVLYNTKGIRVLKHQLNMLLEIKGRP